jgi:dihydroflavonol-4-reductase
VRCLVRSTSSRAELDELGAELCVGDLQDPPSLVRPVEGADFVVHLASLLKVPWKEEFRTVNVGGTAALLGAIAARTSPPITIVVSSLAAAGPSDRPRLEAEEAKPISIYGRVKLESERAAAVHAPKVPVTIVRPPMVFGEGDRYGLALFRSNARGIHLVPSLREHRLSLVHAADLADALVGAAERGERLQSSEPRDRGVYYVAAAEQPLYRELGPLVARACGFAPPRVVRLPSVLSMIAAGISELGGRISDRPTFLTLDKWRDATGGSWICDASKAREQIGFAPRPLDERLAETAAWYRTRGWL